MKNALLMLILSALVSFTAADAYVINGVLDDWGVTPHVQWVPSQSGVSWIEEDDWGSAHPDFPYGGEVYDVEALYCHVVGGWAYIALVTSFPNAEYNYVRPGDIAIDLDRNGVYEYGLQTTGPDQGGLFANPNWWPAQTYPLASPAEFVTGTLVDTQPLVYTNSGIMENGFPTYILESRFDLSLVGSPTAAFDLHWTMSCGNDLLDLTVNPIPEPGTLFLLGPGLLALWAFSRRRTGKDQ